MSMDSLFHHILLTEQQAQEKRRLMREVKLETKNCLEKIKVVTEELSEAKIELEMKVQHLSEKLFHQHLLKKRQEALEEQRDELLKEKRELLTMLGDSQKAMAEEQDKFIREVSDFNSAYGLENNREPLIKKQVKGEICLLEREASVLRNEMERMEHENVHLNALHLQKNSFKQELSELQRKRHGVEDELNEAVITTKYLQAEKVKISQKPQSDPECLRLKNELEMYKDDDMDHVYEALRTEIEFLQMVQNYHKGLCRGTSNLPWKNTSSKNSKNSLLKTHLEVHKKMCTSFNNFGRFYFVIKVPFCLAWILSVVCWEIKFDYLLAFNTN